MSYGVLNIRSCHKSCPGKKGLKLSVLRAPDNGPAISPLDPLGH